jgi:hypothetical protein
VESSGSTYEVTEALALRENKFSMPHEINGAEHRACQVWSV